MAVILETDRAWPDDAIERRILEAAGHTLVCGPPVPAPPDHIEALVREHNPSAIMTCWAIVSEAAVRAPADLRIVERLGVGLDNIAVAAATARGAWVANVPDYCVGEVADHAIALMLAWARGITAFDREVKAARWNPASARLRRVAELTVGIVGLGRIGRNAAAKLQALGCNVIAHTPRADDAPVPVLPLDALLVQSDVVILHCPLTATNKHMINRDTLARIKRSAFLINVSRGPLIDNDALLAALESGQLSGAGLDVIEGEPEPPRALVERPDVIVTPHIAFTSDASLDELRRRAAKEVVRVLAGQPPRHACNQPQR